MKISVNLRHLEKHGMSLHEEVSPQGIELVSGDDLIRFGGPIRCVIRVEKLENSLLAQGHVSVALECDCVRCLRTFSSTVDLPEWVAHLPLSGEEAVAVESDCVDLTPYIREDIFLALPQHPLCSKDCVGILATGGTGNKDQPLVDSGEAETSIWADLDKLKL